MDDYLKWRKNNVEDDSDKKDEVWKEEDSDKEFKSLKEVNKEIDEKEKLKPKKAKKSSSPSIETNESPEVDNG